jgi:surface antigen
MSSIFRAALLLPALALTACATAPALTPTVTTGLTAPDAGTLVAPAVNTAEAASLTDVSAFIDPAALKLMTAASKTAAANAQFNALQFGRVGAPRTWTGDKDQKGQVMVGPYVRVNLIDCRDFTDTVTIGAQTFVSKGTACREADGSWTVSGLTG